MLNPKLKNFGAMHIVQHQKVLFQLKVLLLVKEELGLLCWAKDKKSLLFLLLYLG
jgi:hypothetical protein